MATSQNPFDQFDATPAPTTTGNPFDQFDQPTPPESPIGKAGVTILGLKKKIGDMYLGVAQQPGAGLYSLGTQAASGVAGLWDALVHHGADEVAGKSFSDRFTEEYTKHAKNAADLYQAPTEQGQKITDALGNVLDTIVKGAGDLLYNAASRSPLFKIAEGVTGKNLAPAAGSFGQVMATLAVLGAAPEAKGKAPIDTGNAIADFRANYPKTVRRLEASQVGKADELLGKVTPDEPFPTIVENAIDKELGITQAMKDANPELSKVTLGNKIKILVQKHAAGTSEIVPPAIQTEYANGMVDKIYELQRRIDAIQAAEQPKGLPAPYVLDDPITVDSQGHAVTGEQWQKWYQDIQNMTPDNRATELGIGPMGVNKTALRNYALARDKAMQTDHPADLKNMFKMEKQLQETWNSIFKNPKNMEARKAALDEYINRAGNMSYDEATRLVGPRKGIGGKQKGIFDITGIEKNVEALKHLGEGVTKYAAAGLVNHSGLSGNVNLWRSVRDGAPNELKPGAQLSESQIQRQGFTSKQHTVPANHIVKVQDGHYIYAPPGTDLGPLYRFKDPNGKPITFNDLLPNQPVGRTPLKGQETADQYAARMKAERYAKGMKERRNLATRPTTLDDAVRAARRPYSGRQSGIFDISGLEKNLPATKRSVERAAASGWALQNPEQTANAVKIAMEKNRIAMKQKDRAFTEGLLKKARRGFYAHDYDIRSSLKEAGPLGELAHQRMVVQNGATMAAKTKMDAINRDIFNKFHGKDRDTLNDLIRLRRIIQIDKYKGVGVVRHEEGITGPAAAARVEQMKRELGDEFNRFDNAATSVFEQQKILLDRLRDNGLISQELHGKLYNLDYTRTEYLDLIDPIIPIASHVRNMPQSIRSSGIPELGRGKLSAVNIDAQQLLMEDVARVENRIFRNQTLQAVGRLAEQDPENGIVKLPGPNIIRTGKSGDESIRHTPQGWTAIGVRVKGKQHFILMRDEYAEQFVARPEAMPEWMAITLRTVSGTSLIKLSSTGMNPGFLIAGIPMDIFHTWVTATDVYSPHLPIFLAQIGKDMTLTAKDAFQHTGAWEDAMREGMGSSYLTHESRSLTDPQKSLRSVMMPHFDRIKRVLSYLNDASDMWIRLAYRRRLMEGGDAHNIGGMEGWRATAIARDRLDYYQGGFISKAIDTVVPYANVTVQATGKAFEAAGRDSSAMAIKAAWAVGTFASFKLAGMIAAPETDKAVSVMDKVRGLNIYFGDQYYVMDANGNKRYMYIPLRLDQVLMPLNAAVVGGLELAEYGKIPSGIPGAAVGQVSPISSPFPIPAVDAIATYVTNYDSFTGSSVYKGPKVKPEDEVRTFGEGSQTDPIFNAIGKVTGASPMRMQAATSKLINSNNFYLQAMGAANRLLFKGANPRDQAQSTVFMMQTIPGLRSVVKLTASRADLFDNLQKAEEESGSKTAEATHGINDLVFQYEHGQNDVTQKTIETYINNQPPELRLKLLNHAKYTITVDKVFSTFKATSDIPPRAWWIASAKAPADVRAQQFYNEWVSANAENRKRMMGVANALQANGVGFVSDDFLRYFAEERKLLGDEQR